MYHSKPFCLELNWLLISAHGVLFILVVCFRLMLYCSFQCQQEASCATVSYFSLRVTLLHLEPVFPSSVECLNSLVLNDSTGEFTNLQMDICRFGPLLLSRSCLVVRSFGLLPLSDIVSLF